MLAKLSGAIVLFLLVLLMAGQSVAGRKSIREEKRDFEKKDKVYINTVSGNCVIQKSDDDQIHVEVVNSYRPRDSFEAKMRESKNSIRLSERFYESNSGSSTWTVEIPNGVEVKFESASGSLEIEEIEGVLEASMASGYAEIRNCKGEFFISCASGSIDISNSEGFYSASSASGNVKIEDCVGQFETSSASGNVRGNSVEINDFSAFSSASGNAYLELAATCDHDLEISSATGTARLNCNGHELKGTYEFVAKQRHGDIDSPIDFDKEERFRQNGDKYIRKLFTKSDESPLIAIHTATGRAILDED